MKMLWLEQTEADVPAEAERSYWLSPGERAQLDRLPFPKRRADWLLGRWTAKHAVAQFLRLPSSHSTLCDLEIRSTADGAPEAFLAGEPAPATLSLSHRGGLAVCAVAPSPTSLGCDVELIEPRIATFAADYFAPEEQARVAQAAPDNQPLLVTLIWSAKESALKALRAGLRLDTRSVIASPGDGPGDWHPLHVRHDQGREFSGWWQATSRLVRTVVVDPPAPAPRRAGSSE
ncbi:MAG TPA: 4'-phosphopantetheinyl transferase superfamily protein [Terriglobia bacterium]|nr:4'-phosphopantetheinyl transferase superfamily protein [Terriglobia bacterium]